MTQTTTTGPITLADVKAALGDTNPSSTNAGAVRSIIGRGSYATIQKHLDTIRVEHAPVMPVAPGTAPTAPTEAVAVIWGAAWAQAQVLTLGRLETVTAARDQLADKVAQLGQDLSSALAQVDTATDAAATLIAATDATLASAQAERDAALQDASHAKQALEALKTAFERLKAEGQTNVALAEKDAQNAALTLQATIDRLTDQVGKLKSLLHRQP